MHDLIIVGAGPAGITASVYAARKKLDFLVASEDVGGQTAWSGNIENYTGYQFVTGPELTAKFEEHMRAFAIPLREAESVQEISTDGRVATVRTQKETYTARTVIVASGKRARELGVPGEREFKNRGLTYCATCDGPLFAGKDVAVIGGGNSALDAAIQMLRIARSVHLVYERPELTGDEIMQERVIKAPAVRLHPRSRVTRIAGEKMVGAMTILEEGQEREIAVQGVFVEIGLIPNSRCLPQAEKNDLGEIKVNCRNETNLPGIFAAGDVTDVPEKQIIIAAGEGAKAALSAFRYLVRFRE